MWRMMWRGVKISLLFILILNFFAFGFALKNEVINRWRKPINQNDYNRKVEIGALSIDLHEKVKKWWLSILQDLSWFTLPSDEQTKKQFLDFVAKRAKLWDLHAKANDTYTRAEGADKKEALKLYDQTLDAFAKWKSTVTESAYVLIDMAILQKKKSNIYKNLKDTKGQESSLKASVDLYDIAIAVYKKNPKLYDDGSNPDVHVWKNLQYEKAKNLEEIAALKTNKTEKKKILLEALASYKDMLKYNTIDNCDVWCVMVDSEMIKQVYLKVRTTD